METFDNIPVIITGVADQLLPGVVVEYKTRYSPFQYEGYADSMQWRLYCQLFDVPAVNYKVWEMKRIEETNFCSVKSFNDFTLYEYPAMRSEIREAVTELVRLLFRLGIDREPVLQYSDPLLEVSL